jgi:hypothetical protein
VHGVPTDEATIAEFRAHYLYSGNAAESARHVGIPERTGREIATRLTEEPGFAEDRRKIRAMEVDESVAARRRIREKSVERFESETGGIETKRFGDGENGVTVVITDKRWEYGKLVLDAEKNALALFRVDAELKGDIKPEGNFTIVVRPTANAEAKIAAEAGDASAA